MKKLLILLTAIIFLSVIWIYKKDIVVALMPKIINLINPISENREVSWPKGAIIESDKPNIIIILTDDMGFNDVSYYNGGAADGSLQTPNIDRLAKEGVAFLNGYAASPVCSPSRAAIMTGRYSSRFGFEFTPYQKSAAFITNLLRKDDGLNSIQLDNVEWDEYGLDVSGLPSDEITVAEILQDNGYYTAHVGKWHLGGLNKGMRPIDQGFNDSLQLTNALYLPKNHPDVVNAKIDSTIEDMVWASAQYSVTFNGSEDFFEPDGYITDYYTNETLKIIENNKDRPFFIYLNHFAPHNPLQSLKSDYEKNSHMDDHVLQVYSGMIEAIDRSVAKILNKLKELDLSENTLIIFTSDNGGAGYISLDNINKPYRGWKLTHFEGGVHVPFFARWPRVINANTVYKERVHHTDIFSTILGAANIEIPNSLYLDGVNLLPYINNIKKQIPHETIFWKNSTYQAIIHKDWKLMRESELIEQEFLFDLQNDPYETNNVIEENIAVAKLLNEMLDDHVNSLPDPIWPQSVIKPVSVDSTETKYKVGDQLIYWPN